MVLSIGKIPLVFKQLELKVELLNVSNNLEWFLGLCDDGVILRGAMEFDRFINFDSLRFEVLWRERNDVIHGRARTPHESLARKLGALKGLYNPSLIIIGGHDSANKEQWDPPPKRWVKINIDVVVRLDLAVVTSVV